MALEAAGLPCNHFAGHSFRIGAAPAAAKASIEDSDGSLEQYSLFIIHTHTTRSISTHVMSFVTVLIILFVVWLGLLANSSGDNP